MNKLDKLISKIDSFSTRALLSFLLTKKAAEPQGYYMPDDEEDEEAPAPAGGEDVGKYNELLHVAGQINDPGLSSELVLLAELYKKAIEIGGGYNSINRSIHNIINMYLEDEEDPQQEEIEDILNEIVSDLRKRAGGAAGLAKPDSPEAIKSLKQMKDNFNTQNLQQEVYDLSNYEESATSTFDPTGGVGKEEAGKGFGRGHSFTTRKSLKDWVFHYENEIQRYSDLLNSVTSPAIKDNIQKLVAVLKQLQAGTVEENKLTENYSTTNDESVGNQLSKVKEDNKKLKVKRTALKQSIRTTEISRSIDTLAEQLNTARDEKDKERIRQEIELLKLSISKDIGKKEERNWRQLLLKSMSGGNWPSQETRQKMEKQIQDASAKKIPIKQYLEEQAKENAKKRGKIPITEEIQKQREEQGLLRYDPALKNVPQDRNWDEVKLGGFIASLSQAMLAERKTAKDRLVGSKNTKVKEEEKAKFKPYLDEIAKASLAKDRSSLLKAVHSLRTAIASEVRLRPEFNQYVISVKLSKRFHAFKEALSAMEKSQIESKESINQREADYIYTTVQNGRKMAEYFKNLEITSLSGTKYKNPYATPVLLVSKACNYLENLLRGKPIDVSKTSSLLNHINTMIRQAALRKAAQMVEQEAPPDISDMEAMNMANSIFDKLWDQTVDQEADKLANL